MRRESMGRALRPHHTVAELAAKCVGFRVLVCLVTGKCVKQRENNKPSAQDSHHRTVLWVIEINDGQSFFWQFPRFLPAPFTNNSDSRKHKTTEYNCRQDDEDDYVRIGLGMFRHQLKNDEEDDQP